MKRIFFVRLNKVEYEDLHKFFNFVRYITPKKIDKYLVQTVLTGASTGNVWYESAEFRVHDVDRNMLGIFKLKNFTDRTLINFYIEDNNYRQEFIEYIQSTIEEMKLVGFTILHAVGFSEDTINLEIEEKTDFPTKEINDQRSNDDLSTYHKSDTTSEDITEKEEKPWEHIDESDRKKEMVKLLHEGLSYKDIAEKLFVEIDTVRNRTSEMRVKYGDNVVPYKQAWRNNKNLGKSGK